MNDLKVEGLSTEGRFRFAYGAVHALALAALRSRGYRTDKRFLVFQCLPHTVGLSKTKSRVLVQCHDLRNRAEYEGELDVAPKLVDELIEIADELLVMVGDMGPSE